jgi:hypothetical protein
LVAILLEGDSNAWKRKQSRPNWKWSINVRK